MTKQLLLAGFALATLALNACSSEPSDWRPGEKVSLDMIPPGTRPDQYFDKKGDAAEVEANAAAIPRPINSETHLEPRPMPPAGETVSKNAEGIKEKHADESGDKTEKRAAKAAEAAKAQD